MCGAVWSAGMRRQGGARWRRRFAPFFLCPPTLFFALQVFDLLNNGAHIYFCGLKGMMPGGSNAPGSPLVTGCREMLPFSTPGRPRSPVFVLLALFVPASPV